MVRPARDSLRFFIVTAYCDTVYSMAVNRHIRLFDSIARPYGWFHRSLTRKYLDLIHLHLSDIGLSPGSRVLDVGCGPGSFGLAFKRSGFLVEGVDGSSRMAAIAESNGIECRVADATENLPYADNSFSMVTAAYVAHGFPSEHRVRFYLEMNRVASNLVLLHDFSPASGGFPFLSVIGALERLEGSDYLGFRRKGLTELESIFENVAVLPVDPRVSWYLCRTA